jgi:hypothetical protein
VRTEPLSSLTGLIARLSAAPLALATRTTIVMETHLEKFGGIALTRPGRA